MRKFDVIIMDSVGVPFCGDSPLFNGLGGSELEQILLAEELVKNGIKVACINHLPSWSRVRGVEYFPLEMISYEKFSCKSLILERITPAPSKELISFDKKFRWVTDCNPSVENDENVICVSMFQSRQIQNSENVNVIYNMIPDALYDIKHNRNTKYGSFIYASAAMKGLQQTINFFSSMRSTPEFKNATLKVLNPGYDLPKNVKADGVEFLGALPFFKVVDEMMKCRSLLHFSTFRETFGIVHVMAEILGLNLFVFQSTGPDALREVCNSDNIMETPTGFNGKLAMYGKNPQSFTPVIPGNYRSSKIIKEWMKLLGFSCTSSLVDGKDKQFGIELLVQPG